MPRDRISRRPRLLIVRSEGVFMEPLTITTDGGAQVLPVFSFREEAEMYLRLCSETPGCAWRARESSNGELASILCGPCREVEAVALDPLPEACGGTLNKLLSVGREEFVLALLDEESAKGDTLMEELGGPNGHVVSAWREVNTEARPGNAEEKQTRATS